MVVIVVGIKEWMTIPYWILFDLIAICYSWSSAVTWIIRYMKAIQWFYNLTVWSTASTSCIVSLVIAF